MKRAWVARSVAVGMSLFGLGAAAAASMSSDWAVADTVTVGVTSFCKTMQCPLGPVSPRGPIRLLGCDWPTQCCNHYNCNLMQSTEAICCNVSSVCVFGYDINNKPATLCVSAP